MPDASDDRHHIGETEPPSRHKRKGVLNLKNSIQQHVQQPLDKTANRQALNCIQQESVNIFENSLPVIDVFGVKPSPIVDDELELPLDIVADYTLAYPDSTAT